MSATHDYKGGCLCGSVRFSIARKPIWAGYCHCNSCRKATGALAVMHVGFAADAVQFTHGQPTYYDSSPGVKRGFCNQCGTPLLYQAARFPNYLQLYIGLFDRPNLIEPQAHVHHDEKILWFHIDDGLPRYSGSAATESDSWKDA